MTTRLFVVECYSPAVTREAVESAGDRARTATAVEYLGALLVPGDEVVFHLFAARSADAVRDASLQAGLDFERVLESEPIGIDSLSGAVG